MNSSVEGWCELKTPARSECPKLFYHFSTREAGIDLYVTDLVEIWAYNLNSDEILQEARKQKSSIDPSESRSQSKVLIQKLQQALADGNNQLIQGSDTKNHDLQLKTSFELPKPLKPLEWTFKLLPQEASSMAEQVLRPCLHEASVLNQKLESLRNIIKAKDHVIAKLVERIENSGTDLSLIFPGTTGFKSRKGTVTVNEAKKHVSGLAEFKEADWLSHFDTDSSSSGFDQLGLHNLIAGCEKCSRHTAEEHQSWFKDLPRSFQDVKLPSPTSKDESNIASERFKADQLDDDEATASEEDEFERQATPPGLRSGRPILTDVESGDEPPPKKKARTEEVSLSGVSNANKNNPGSISSKSNKLSEDVRMGGSSSDTSTATETASEAEEPGPAQPIRSSKLGELKSKRSSKQGKEQNHSSPHKSSSSESDHEKSIPSRRLGRLGGARGKGEKLSSSAAASASSQGHAANDGINDEGDSVDDTNKASAPKTRRLGRLGVSKKSADNELANASHSASPDKGDEVKSPKPETSESQSQSTPPHVRKAKTPTPEPEETEEQKANRRREELKRTIATTSARKKRKF